MRSRYKLLLQKRHELVTEGSKNLAQLEQADVTPEARQAALRRDDEIQAELATLNAEIAVFERQLERERALVVPDSARISVEPVPGDPKGGFGSIADFARAVRTASIGGRVDDRLAAFRAAPTGYHQEAASAEGYMVPPAYRQEIWDLVFGLEDVLSLVAPEPTASNSVQWLRDETTPWGASGIQAKWRAEATQMVASKLVTEPAQLLLHELYAFVTATEELLQDAPALNARLTRKAADAIRWKASESIVNGTGAGQPLGWMKSPALVTITKESGQAADTIVVQNIVKMYARLLALPGGRPTWFANRDIVPQLVDLKIGDQPIWVGQNAGLREAPAGVLLGIPLRFTEHAETLGDKGDLQLVDLAGYYATTRTDGLQFASSIHLFFDYGVQAFRWTFRLGGQPFLSAPVTPAKGAATKSHFVCIEARA